VGAEANVIEPEAEPTAPASAAPAPQAASAGPGRPLLGARHDLSLVAERATAKCNCLDVGLGAANAETFRWQSSPPSIDPETQLVVAVSTADSHCTASKAAKKKPSLGASYWGYRIVGNDVVVYVESAHRGRPVTAGGIIPKPVGDGQVWLSPASKQLPFGRPLEGKGTRCKVGNSPPMRTAPLTQEELGTHAEPPQAPAPEPGQAESSSDWTP